MNEAIVDSQTELLSILTTTSATKQCRNTQTLRRLVFTSLLLAIVVIGLGAYTRLTHAGLGCPDWPTCYGLIDVPETRSQIATAEQAFPERPVEPHKAWNEMIHRYFAGSLGLLIAAIALFSIKLRFFSRSNESESEVKTPTSKLNTNSGLQAEQKYPLFLPLCLLVVVIFQAALGMWTVTLKLMPIIVMAHLLGGFTTLCLLFLLYLRINSQDANNKLENSSTLTPETTTTTAPQSELARSSMKKYSRYALLGIVILTAQIALGGWTSSNYAAMSCVELPICQGDWLGELTFERSFDLIPPSKSSYEFGHLEHDERVTIHVAHRLGAIITTVFITWLSVMIFIKPTPITLKKSAAILQGVLIIQVCLGISNIWFSLPLQVAVAHNLVAAALMLSLITLAFKLRQHSQEYVYD